jgi:hypothetical protein
MKLDVGEKAEDRDERKYVEKQADCDHDGTTRRAACMNVRDSAKRGNSEFLLENHTGGRRSGVKTCMCSKEPRWI